MNSKQVMKVVKSADEAAIRADESRGHVIVGLVPGQKPLEIGSELQQFAGDVLMVGTLMVKGLADRKDWDRQYKLFGFPGPDKNTPLPGQQYYRCKLIREG